MNPICRLRGHRWIEKPASIPAGGAVIDYDGTAITLREDYTYPGTVRACQRCHTLHPDDMERFVASANRFFGVKEPR